MKKLTSFTLGDTYYFNIYEIRGFIDLHTVVYFLEDIDTAIFEYKRDNDIKSLNSAEVIAIIEKVKEKAPTLCFGPAYKKYKDGCYQG